MSVHRGPARSTGTDTEFCTDAPLALGDTSLVTFVSGGELSLFGSSKFLNRSLPRSFVYLL